MGTFMGGLKPKIANRIGMFKPKTLKEVISLTRMRDDQLNRQGMKPTPIFNVKPAPSMKQLTWDEMQKDHIQGFCFNYYEKFTLNHRCKGPQLLLLEGSQEDEEGVNDDQNNSLHTLTRSIKSSKAKRSFHQLKP